MFVVCKAIRDRVLRGEEREMSETARDALHQLFSTAHRRWIEPFFSSAAGLEERWDALARDAVPGLCACALGLPAAVRLSSRLRLLSRHADRSFPRLVRLLEESDPALAPGLLGALKIGTKADLVIVAQLHRLDRPEPGLEDALHKAAAFGLAFLLLEAALVSAAHQPGLLPFLVQALSRAAQPALLAALPLVNTQESG